LPWQHKEIEDRAPSLYDMICERVGNSPNTPLDDSNFPKIFVGSSELSLVPGLKDVLGWEGENANKQAEEVKQIIREANRKEIRNWAELEMRLHGIGALPSVDAVLTSHNWSSMEPSVFRLFRELARRSRDVEAVKWGIAIGSVSAPREFMEDLLLLARYGEFTLYAGVALIHWSRNYCELTPQLVNLLRMCRGWSVIRLIEIFFDEKDIATDPEVQREILICGMENNEGIPMEVAFTIAKGIDLERFFKEADSDPQVFVALTQLMETLFFEPAPRGGLKDLENGKEILNEFIALLQRRSPPDFRALYSLRNIELFVSDEELAPPGSEKMLKTVRELYLQTFSEDFVRQGLEDSKTRWMALQLIRERRITTLLPDVEQLFELDATSFVIDVLRE